MSNGSRSHHTFSRHVAPFAPLALALLMGRAVLPSADGGEEPSFSGGKVAPVQCEEVLNFQDCHTRFPTGCTAAGKYDAYMNLLKNQLIEPSTAGPVAFLTMKDFTSRDAGAPDGLKKGNHQDFKDDLAKQGEGQIYALRGFLNYAITSGVESSNCQLPNDDSIGTNVDFHIGIGFDADTAKQLRDNPAPGKKKVPKALQQNSVIVEMTPHYRYYFENDIWTIDNVQKAIGRQVRIVGQLVLDSEHFLPSQDCALATTSSERKTCWRASAWELHPVTRFQVCNRSSNDCPETDSSDWIELDKL